MSKIRLFKILIIAVLTLAMSGCDESDSSLEKLNKILVGESEMKVTNQEAKQIETTLSIKMGNENELVNILVDATSAGTYQVGGSSTGNQASYFDGTNLYTTNDNARGSIIIEKLDGNLIQANFNFNVENQGHTLTCTGSISEQLIVVEEYLIAKVDGIWWEASDWISVDTLAGYLTIRGDKTSSNQILMTGLKQKGTQQFGQVIEELNFMTSANYNTSVSNYSTGEIGSDNTGYLTIDVYNDEYVEGSFHFNGYEGTFTGYDPESEVLVTEGKFKINWGHY